ncbi:MAG: OmpA family protein [Bacteroidota bacterium]|nr:OmpA family protein [Bacteroidota bacterium]
MRIFTKVICIVAVALLFSANLMAQKNFSKDADKAFDNREYFNAIELYKKAYTKAKKKEDKAFIIFRTAEAYRLIGDMKQAEAWYIKAIKANYTDPKAKLYLADAKKAQEKYNEALIEYNNYKKEVPSDPRGEDGAKACELAQKWKDAPTRYKVENMALINTKDPDFAPTYADKKYNKLYFTSMRPGVTGGSTDPTLGELYSDIFETMMDKNGKWSTATAILPPINTKDNEGLTAMTKKGDLLIFTRCSVEKNKEMNNQLWYATKKGNTWGDPVKVEFCQDSLEYASPTISSDGQTMIFASNMAGGQGGSDSKDLWITKFDKKNRKWSDPKNLGSTINTGGTEVFPFLHDDGTLYFSSNGHLGMGGWDVFKAEKKGEDQWGNVTNMRYPINSAGDDFGIVFEGKKERGYLSSNREGTKGADDIWSFVLPPLLFTIEGVVSDCEFKEVIPGVTVKLVGSDGSSVETKTDQAGYYKFAENGDKRYVNPNTSYIITIQVGNEVKTMQAPQGFLASSDKPKVTTVGVEEARTFKNDFCLVPIKKFIRFPDVLYLLGKADLEHPSNPRDSLNFLYQTLLDNPTFVIELSSHTDFRGSDAANQKLSEARAKSCVEYLISKGINPARLKAKGYGEKYPLEVYDANGKVMYTLTEKYITKETKGKSKEEFEALMQKNRRTVFSVLSKDFVDPNAPKDEPKVVPTTPKTEEEDEE